MGIFLDTGYQDFKTFYILGFKTFHLVQLLYQKQIHVGFELTTY